MKKVHAHPEFALGLKKPAANGHAPAPQIVQSWMKQHQADGSIIYRPGTPVELADEIGTREAAKICGLSQRRINAMCDEGVLLEGRDWWRPPGSRRNGNYRIKRAAIWRIKTFQHV
jgi:hypothetical protein